MTSIVTHPNRAPLEYGGMEGSHHGCVADNLQILCEAITVIRTKISGCLVSGTLLNLCHEELRHFDVNNEVASECNRKWHLPLHHLSFFNFPTWKGVKICRGARTLKSLSCCLYFCSTWELHKLLYFSLMTVKPDIFIFITMIVTVCLYVCEKHI